MNELWSHTPCQDKLDYCFRAVRAKGRAITDRASQVRRQRQPKHPWTAANQRIASSRPVVGVENVFDIKPATKSLPSAARVSKP